MKRRVGALLTFILCLILFGYNVWPTTQKKRILSTDQGLSQTQQPTEKEKAQEPSKKIWSQPTPSKPQPQKTTAEEFAEQGHIGPRLEFAGLKVEHNDGYSIPVIQVHNTSEIAVSSYQLIGSIFLSDFENNLENEDVNNVIRRLEDAAKNVVLAPVDQLQITRGMGILLKLQQRFSDSDIASVNTGSKKMYVSMLAIYITPKTPKNRMWVTEMCALVTKPFTEFQSCPSHNRYFFSDRTLNKID